MLSWLAGQSARQCGPCAHGLPAIARLAEAMADGRAAPAGASCLQRWSGQAAGPRCLPPARRRCAFLGSALELFGRSSTSTRATGRASAARRPVTLAAPTATWERAAA